MIYEEILTPFVSQDEPGEIPEAPAEGDEGESKEGGDEGGEEVA